MPEYTIKNLIGRYNEVLSVASEKNADQDKINKEIIGLLYYVYEYSSKELTDKEFETISMILSHVHEIATEKGAAAKKEKVSKKPRMIMAREQTKQAQQTATQDVRGEHHAESAEQHTTRRGTLVDRARARAEIASAPRESSRQYQKIKDISELTVQFAPRSTGMFMSLAVELEHKQPIAIEREKLGTSVHDGKIRLRIRDKTDDIVVSVSLDKIWLSSTKQGATIEEVSKLNFREATVSVKGTLREESLLDLYGKTVYPSRLCLFPVFQVGYVQASTCNEPSVSV